MYLVHFTTLLCITLAACTSPLPTPTTQAERPITTDAPTKTQTPIYSGHISIKIEANDRETPNILNADFDLTGDTQAGALVLTGPLGIALAKVQWDPQGAQLQNSQGVHHYESVEQAFFQTLGTDLSLKDLFSLLSKQKDGGPVQNTTAQSISGNWTINETTWKTQGKLYLSRQAPLPKVQISITLAE